MYILRVSSVFAAFVHFSAPVWVKSEFVDTMVTMQADDSIFSFHADCEVPLIVQQVLPKVGATCARMLGKSYANENDWEVYRGRNVGHRRRLQPRSDVEDGEVRDLTDEEANAFAEAEFFAEVSDVEPTRKLPEDALLANEEFEVTDTKRDLFYFGSAYDRNFRQMYYSFSWACEDPSSWFCDPKDCDDNTGFFRPSGCRRRGRNLRSSTKSTFTFSTAAFVEWYFLKFWNCVRGSLDTELQKQCSAIKEFTIL